MPVVQNTNPTVTRPQRRRLPDERRAITHHFSTNEIYYAQLVEEESTETVMAALREVIEKQDQFCSLYSDRGAHFWLTPKAGSKVELLLP